VQAAAPHAQAQVLQPGKVYRVAIVLTTSPIAEMTGPDPVHPLTRAILHELRALGYVEGENLVFERRSAAGDPKRYRPIVEELVELKCDAIILSGSRELVRAAHAATRTVPLVLMGYATAVEDGFAKSLARPGGNITGRSAYPSLDVSAKAMQLLKEAVPGLSRVALLSTADTPAGAPRVVRDAARELGVEVVPIEHRGTDLRASFATIAKARVGGIYVMPSATAYAQRETLGPLALEARLPGMFPFARIAETGGLMSYSPNIVKDVRNVAHYVDRILKGAYPGDLPMENARVFDLTINLKTANALGLTIPQSILLRADRVIE
jgi:ABC-type uncharacterized transport system substrate-binding protein